MPRIRVQPVGHSDLWITIRYSQASLQQEHGRPIQSWFFDPCFLHLHAFRYVYCWCNHVWWSHGSNPCDWCLLRPIRWKYLARNVLACRPSVLHLWGFKSSCIAHSLFAITAGVYALIGASSFFGGVTRITMFDFFFGFSSACHRVSHSRRPAAPSALSCSKSQTICNVCIEIRVHPCISTQLCFFLPRRSSTYHAHCDVCQVDR